MEFLRDWFALFCIMVVALPPVLANADLQDAFNYFVHPANLICFAFMALVVLGTHQERSGATSFWDRHVARWYLLNGVIIHILLDGLVGVFKINPMMAKQYAVLDARYADSVGGVAGSAVHVISGIELFLKGPLCIFTYYAIHRRCACRDVLEIIIGVVQIYGTLMYLFQEMLTGMPSIQVDYKLSFTFFYITYFWFAFVFCQLLWIFYPAYLSWLACCRVVAAEKCLNFKEGDAASSFKSDASARSRTPSKRK